MGFTHIIQIDAGGQHDSNDIAQFIDYSREISGKPYFDVSAPKIRVYGRRITDVWVVLETLSLQIKDALCGFRVYPLSVIEILTDRYYIGVRMDFDIDILVKAVWLSTPLHFILTKVIYPQNSVSHFHYLGDNSLLIRLHVRLLFDMFARLPWLILNKISKNGGQNYAK